MQSSWLGMELGKKQVKLMRFGFVLGGFVLLWETQKESKKTTGHSQYFAGTSSKKEHSPTENVFHLLPSQQRPRAGLVTPAGVWDVIQPAIKKKKKGK